MIATYRRRWSDNDYNLGPFTYARADRHYRPLGICLRSGDEEHPDDVRFQIAGFGHMLLLALPGWCLRPYRYKVQANWDEETKVRMGKDWFWMTYPREFGLSITDGHLNVSFGRQTMDSSTEQRWGWFLPWTQWRSVRRSFYGLYGEHVATSDGQAPRLGDNSRWDQEQKLAKSTPTASFVFDDFDGERITATTRIEEREWRFGDGWFKWLSLFRAPKIRRSLDIEFSTEVGPEKGSWKGGTLGHAIDMEPGELHKSAFKRYCDQHNLTFVGLVK